ncbi:MAG: hypothetical protein JNL18_09315 [Planctomycetaceae bacterium]|nr:hypothetical protein [Anaerolineae bacterium]MBL9162919.1 hypothetical protein [Planctomycetaceae bacterium]
MTLSYFAPLRETLKFIHVTQKREGARKDKDKKELRGSVLRRAVVVQSSLLSLGVLGGSIRTTLQFFRPRTRPQEKPIL